MIKATAAILLVLSVTVGSAGAAENVASSENVTSVDVAKTTVWNHQAVFKKDLMFVGTADFGGFDVFRLGDDDPIKKIGTFPCYGSGEGALSRWGKFVFQPIETDQDGSPQAGICGEEPASGGIRVVDVSSPANPRKVGFIALDCGSHNVTISPRGGKLWIYNSNGCGGGGEGVPGPSTGQGGHGGTALTVEVIRFNPRDPSQSHIQSKPVLEMPGRPETKMAGCHDITIFHSRDLGVCVGVGRSLLIDVSDPPNPVGLGMLDTGHIGAGGASFSWDGDYLFLNEIPFKGAGYGESCLGARRSAGGIDVWDVSSPGSPRFVTKYLNPRQAPMWAAPDMDYRCFAMDVIMVPMADSRRYVALTSWGSAGLSVVDFTDPAAPTELAHWTPQWATVSYWNYWYKGRIYISQNNVGEPVSPERPPNPLPSPLPDPVPSPWPTPLPPSDWSASVRVLEMSDLGATRQFRSGFVPQWQDTSDLRQ